MYSDGLKILSLMQRWSSKREMMGDDPPYLAVGTEVSAKYKGAFCEAKVRKIVRSVKCKVAYKLGLGSSIVTDDQIKGTLRAGSVVEVKHSEKKEYVEATILKIQDCSQYTVVFDDGDITTLRRTALCLKSGRHFAESETLDQLPLTHPEHFGNPVIGGRRGRRNRHDDSSDDEGTSKKIKLQKEEKEADIGKVVCVEISEKKKQKDNWFPGLVVAPTAQDTVKINVKEDYLVRSFKDGRYYTVPKKEAASFTREIGQKVDNNTLRTAVEKALQFLDRDELPPHWDRELLFGLNEISDSDSDGAFDSDTSDDEPREEKDHFVAQLYKFMDDRGTPINKGPTINNRDVDLYKLFKVVHKLGGYNRVTNHNQWKTVSHKLGFGQTPTSVNLVKHAYKKFLHSFEDFYRKLGCTMVNHPRGHRSRHRSSRSLIRDKDKAAPTKDKIGEKDMDEIKVDPLVEPCNESDSIKEEIKLKDVLDISKPQRELRKESQRTRIDKVEKKEDIKILSLAVKPLGNEASVINKLSSLRDDKSKYDDREERLKLREIVKLENCHKDDLKYDKDAIQSKVVKELKHDDVEKSINVKVTRREAKEGNKDEKLDDKIKAPFDKDVRPKKPFISNPSSNQNFKEKSNISKSRGLFSKLKGSKRMKSMPDNKMLRMGKSIGLNSVRQKRTFSERMKAMVKKFKIKTGVMHLRHKSPPAPENLESEEKKKLPIEECSKSATSQLTRSRSKDEVSSKVLKIGQEKKPNLPSSSSQAIHMDKKQTKKRKEDDKYNSNDETLDQLPNYKSVSVGDKLKVYYGPTHESKVTYEAKVLNVKEEEQEIMYLVHYTGWNTRYDEWIKRSRIADNLSWTPGRAKRARSQQVQNCGSRIQKKAKNVDVCSSNSGSVPRSTTPSSVTSSSSRTKSPAVGGAPRSMRSRAHSRRISGHTHTDFSESEMDDDYESDDLDTIRISRNKEVCINQRLSNDDKDSKELLQEKMRNRPYRKKVESGGENEEISRETNVETILRRKKIKEEIDEEKFKIKTEKRKSEDLHKPILSNIESCRKDIDGNRNDRLRNKRKTVDGKSTCGDEIENKQLVIAEENHKQPLEDKNKLDCKMFGSDNDTDMDENNSKKKWKEKIDEPYNDEDCNDQQLPERRRSKRVVIHRKEDLKSSLKYDSILGEQPKGRDFDLNQIRSELKGISTSNKISLEIDNSDDPMAIDLINIEENSSKEIFNLSPEDIYEFKEPEPFEFEVRSKCGDDRGQRRGFGRVTDEGLTNLQSALQKNSKQTKAELIKALPENASNVSKAEETEVLEGVLNHSSSGHTEYGVKVEHLTKGSNIPEVCLPEIIKMDTFDKSSELVENKNNDNYQLSDVLSDLTGETNETESDQYNEEQLVVSETESQETIYSDTNKNHESFLNNSMSQSPSAENEEKNSLNSGLTKNVKEEFVDKTEDSDEKYENENQDIGSEQSGENENEIDDDPILSAIKRVQQAFSQTLGDEDSNDIDLLSELGDPIHKEENNPSTVPKDNNTINVSKESSTYLRSDNPVEVRFNLYPPDDNINCNTNFMRDCSKVFSEISSESSCSETNTEVSQEQDNSNKHSETVASVDNTVEFTNKIGNPHCNENTDKALFNEVIDVSECKVKNDKDEKDNDETDTSCDTSEENSENVLKIETNDEIKVEEDEQTEEQTQVNNDLDSISINNDEIGDSDDECDMAMTSEIIKIKDEEEDNKESSEEELLESNIKENSDKNVTVSYNIDDAGNNIESLLCEETIPGSPTPTSSVLAENALPMSSELPFASTAGLHTVVLKPSTTSIILPPPPPLPVNGSAAANENTPPSTPENSLSPISNSPKCERGALSPVHENDSSKSNRDFPEVDMDSFVPPAKHSSYCEEDTNFGLGSNIETIKKSSEDFESQNAKKRRSHKIIEETNKRIKSHRSPRHCSAMGSESDDDTSEHSLELLSVHSRSPRPSKYNFTVQLDSELDATQRIALLQHNLSDLRKTYMSVKTELASIDRRRKKLRRREREASVKTNLKPEVTCS